MPSPCTWPPIKTIQETKSQSWPVRISACLTNTPFGHVLEHYTLLFNYAKMKAGEKYDFNCFYTCNLSLPRQAVVDVGMFDEAFGGPAAEDIELGYRLFQRGYWVLYEPKCMAWHHHDMTPTAFCRTHRTRGEGAMTLMLRQPDAPWYRGTKFADCARAPKPERIPVGRESHCPCSTRSTRADSLAPKRWWRKRPRCCRCCNTCSIPRVGRNARQPPAP